MNLKEITFETVNLWSEVCEVRKSLSPWTGNSRRDIGDSDTMLPFSLYTGGSIR